MDPTSKGIQGNQHNDKNNQRNADPSTNEIGEGVKFDPETSTVVPDTNNMLDAIQESEQTQDILNSQAPEAPIKQPDANEIPSNDQIESIDGKNRLKNEKFVTVTLPKELLNNLIEDTEAAYGLFGIPAQSDHEKYIEQNKEKIQQRGSELLDAGLDPNIIANVAAINGFCNQNLLNQCILKGNIDIQQLLHSIENHGDSLTLYYDYEDDPDNPLNEDYDAAHIERCFEKLPHNQFNDCILKNFAFLKEHGVITTTSFACDFVSHLVASYGYNSLFTHESYESFFSVGEETLLNHLEDWVQIGADPTQLAKTIGDNYCSCLEEEQDFPGNIEAHNSIHHQGIYSVIDNVDRFMKVGAKINPTKLILKALEQDESPQYHRGDFHKNGKFSFYTGSYRSWAERRAKDVLQKNYQSLLDVGADQRVLDDAIRRLAAKMQKEEETEWIEDEDKNEHDTE